MTDSNKKPCCQCEKCEENCPCEKCDNCSCMEMSSQAFNTLLNNLLLASNRLEELGLNKAAGSVLNAIEELVGEVAVKKIAWDMGDEGMIDDTTLSELGLKSEEPMGSSRSGDIARDILSSNPDLKTSLKDKLLEDRTIQQPRHQFDMVGSEDFDKDVIPDIEFEDEPNDDTMMDEILADSLSPTQIPPNPDLPKPSSVRGFDDYLYTNPDVSEEEALERDLTPTSAPGKISEDEEPGLEMSELKESFEKLEQWIQKKAEESQTDEDFEDEE